MLLLFNKFQFVSSCTKSDDSVHQNIHITTIHTFSTNDTIQNLTTIISEVQHGLPTPLITL